MIKHVLRKDLENVGTLFPGQNDASFGRGIVDAFANQHNPKIMRRVIDEHGMRHLPTDNADIVFDSVYKI